MTNREKEIRILVEKYLRRDEQKDNEINLISTTFDEDEICDAIDSLLTTHLTMGKKVSLFEKKWDNYLEIHSSESIRSVMVNSGSSANLLALSVLMDKSIQNHLKVGDEVIVPAVTWSTTIFPIFQLGLVPVVVDVDIETMTMSLENVERAITNRTKAIMPVHLLGNPCDMTRIMKLARKYSLFVIEDCCEAHGAKINDQMVGTFGDISTFSFFYSHHITTIEGGMVSTKHPDWLSTIRSYRAHGWVREREDREELIEKFSDLDSRFLFVSPGYNLRPTDINGAFGIHQIDRLEGFIEKRIKNHLRMIEIFSKYNDHFHIPRIRDNTRHSAFAFGIVIKDTSPIIKKELQGYLEENNIQTRPIAGSNLLKQPGFKDLDIPVKGDLNNSNIIHENGFWIGNHPKITEKQLVHLEKVLDDFMKQIQE